jgi:anti-anti-sigma factor
MAVQLEISLEAPSSLRLIGDIDTATEGGLRAAFSAINGAVALDMADVTFIDSTGLRVILARMALTPVRLTASSTAVRKVFDLAGVERLSDGQLALPMK